MADLALTIKELQQELEALREENAKLKESYEKQKVSYLQEEESLKTSEVNYQKLYSMIRLMSDTMPDLLWAKGLDKKFLFVNEAMCRTLLNASDTFEPIGKTDLFFAQRERESHPDDTNWHTFGELCMDSDAVTLKEMKPMQFDEFGNVKGKFIFLDVHKAPLINRKGEIIGVVGSARDITKSKITEKALTESEREHRNLVENMHEGLIVVDRNDVIHFVNPALCSMLGYKKEELIGKVGYEILVNTINREIILNKNKERLTGINDRYELQFIKKNGKPIHILMNASPLRDSENNIIGSFATCLDITQQKEAANFAESTKRNYDYFFNSIGDFLFVLDTNGNIIHVNNTVKNRLEYSDEELLGKSVLIVHPEERREEAGRIVEEMLKGKAEFCPVPLKTKSGDLIPVETRVTFGIWDDKPAIFGVTKDISAIRLSEEKFSKAFHLNSSACGFSDIKTGVYIEVNEAFTTLLGFTKEEVIGKTPYELEILTEKSKTSILQNAKENGIVKDIEATLKAKNGEIKNVLLSAENMFIQDRKVRYTVVHDITQRKTYEKALFESNLLFENVIKGTNVGTWKWNVQTGETEFNERWAEMLGYTLEELKPISIKTWETLSHPDDLKTAEELLGKVFDKSLDYYDCDCRMKHRNGSWIWVQDRGKIVEWTEDGKPLIMAGTHSDITSRKNTEEMLSASEAKFRNIIDISPIPMALNDGQMNITYLNPSFIRTFGYTLQDIPTVSDWWPKAYPDPTYGEWVSTEWIKELKRVKSTGEEFRPMEVKVRCKNGFNKTVMASSSVYSYEQENDHLIVLFDITERKLAEEALRESEDRYRAVSQYSNNAICIVNENAKVEWVNHQMLTVSGYTEEQILNSESFATFIASESQEFVFSNFQKVLLGQEYIHHYEFYLIHADGSKRLYEKYMMHYTDKYGKLKLLIDMTDITDSRNAQLALVQTNQQLEAIISASPDGIGMITLDGKMLLASDKLATMNGYTNEEAKEVLGRSVLEFIDPSCHQLLKDNIKKLLEGKNEEKLSEYIAIRKDKSRFHIDINSTVLYDQNGKPSSLLFIERDITERKRVEEELEKHRKHLEELVKERTAELNKANISLRREIEKQKEYEMLLKNSLTKEKELSMMKSSFISTASHEFRTPLTSILSSSEMLQRYKKKWDEAKKDEHFDRIKRQVGYLTKLLDDVLLISKTESGRIEYNPSEVNIKQLIEDSLKESKAQMQESHKVVKKFTCEKNTFNVDGKLMRFIVSNLLSNAIKFSPNGGKIEIKTDCNAKDLKLAISDQGIGLAPEDVNKIFQSFYRSSNVGAISGTGLGLSIVHHAVELHGGKIIVKSELGKGTTFEVSIPLKKKKTVK